MAADPAHRHGGPDAGWYVPGPDGWQRISDSEVRDHDDAAHFMSDPNGRTMGGNGGGIYWDPANTHIISGPLSFTSHGGASIGQKPPAS